MLDPHTNYYLVKERMKELQDEVNRSGPGPKIPIWPLILIIAIVLACLHGADAFAAIPRLPGSDQSDKLQAAGTLLRIIDSAIFSWGARIFAGLLILNAGVSLKNQAFGLAFISVVGAIVVGTAPMWVKNIFDMGGGTLFSMLSSFGGIYV
ncbi:MAG: hypothetical protein COV91_03475 [Candidatus Taylorbacteria bacterium CG11_big_fil_rev_8_21_14_0_20_46_11]|uniref:Uncharacterized protein n=1 Tax=Candidatus Taylorbacteria bacterium CG11_big_fil_rev_8_21_14_0_20_46_11 TaxID=1975025 RepID=A0A2H0KBC6_9BACT|nr:MAG: hypothetical protein COV91_03475 [Candidatus Taylorbacteria bacterium CG11_big_fil_rev_8_21_14_0_20_46_11]